jgi:hypothetical protein
MYTTDPLADYAAHDARQVDALDDMSADTFADWLAGQCFQRDGTALSLTAPGYVVEAADVPALLLTAFDAARRQRHEFASYLLREIERRFDARGV